MSDTRIHRWRFRTVLCLVSLALCASVSASTLAGRVVDREKKPLAGVAVILTGETSTSTSVTTAGGEFRFDGLAAGQYTVLCRHRGFASGSSSIELGAGRLLELIFTLDVTFEESITVVGDSPLTEESSSVPSTSMSRVDLQRSTERDPWAVLQSAPGVLPDRLNGGGEQLSEQVTAVSKGATGEQTAYVLDGTTITDMTQAGASPMFFDFDSFDSIKVTTSGSDPEIQTPGTRVSLSTMRGTERFQGSARWFFTRDGMQAEATVPEEAEDYMVRESEIRSTDEYGAEAGGPLLRDRLWLWASASRHEVDLAAPQLSPYPASFAGSEISNLYAKLTARAFAAGTMELLAIRSEVTEDGRGVSSVRPPETGLSRSAPTTLVKADGLYLFSPSFYATLSVALGQFGYTLTPAGGMDVDMYVTPDRIPHRSYSRYDTDRPQQMLRVALSRQITRGSQLHSLRAGAGARSIDSKEFRDFPGTGAVAEFENSLIGEAVVTRPANARYSVRYYDAHIGDDLTLGRNSISAALRFDLQEGKNKPSSTTASELFPDLLPAAEFQGDARSLEWSAISPRFGVSRQIDAANRVRVRASFNRYVDQLGARVIGAGNPFYAPQQMTYVWRDENFDKTVQREEARTQYGPVDWSGLDPDNPSDPTSTRRIDYSMRPPQTDELTAGIDVQLRPSLLVRADYIHREKNDFVWLRPEKTQGAGDFYSSSDYIPAGQVTGTTPDGRPYTVPYYRLAPGVSAPRWFVVTNRPDYSQSWDGVDLVVEKQLSGRWMLRVAAAWGEWQQYVGVDAVVLPTPLLEDSGCTTCNDAAAIWSPTTEEEIERNVFINSRWSGNATALVLLPRNFSVTMNLYVREGYPLPYYRRIFAGDQTGAKNVLVGGVDGTRLPDVMQLDARLAKELTIRRTGVTLSLDVFNLTNRRTVLERDNLLSNVVSYPDPANNHIVEIQSPRVFRAGVRLTF